MASNQDREKIRFGLVVIEILVLNTLLALKRTTNINEKNKGDQGSGKSTLCGRLQQEMGLLSYREMENLKREAQSLANPGRMYALAMDRSSEARKRGMTVSANCMQLLTSTHHYTVIDTPGHRTLMKHVIRGMFQANVALLIVPANRDAFEAYVANGDHKMGKLAGQARAHALLLHAFGVNEVIVCVNKMDDVSVNYEQERFEEVALKMEKILRAKHKGEGGRGGRGGEEEEEEKKEDSTLIMPVWNTFQVKGVGRVVLGRVQRGTVTTNTCVKFIPSNARGMVFSIESHYHSMDHADAGGDYVGVHVRHWKDYTLFPRVGDIMCLDDQYRRDYDPNANANANANGEFLTLEPVVQFTALVVVVVDHSGKLMAQALNYGHGGYTPCVFAHTAKAACQLQHIHWKKSPATSTLKEDTPDFISAYDEAEVVFVPKVPFVVCPYKQCPALGLFFSLRKRGGGERDMKEIEGGDFAFVYVGFICRLIVLDSNSLVMIGKVLSVVTASMAQKQENNQSNLRATVDEVNKAKKKPKKKKMCTCTYVY
ncbi:elongation factor 1-alpha (EF-1-ALPHA), partial [Reticulomyxa filosa]